MKEKCDMCGQMEECNTIFQFNDPVFLFKLKFCCNCRDKILDFVMQKEPEP
jgi:hypothetical protein